MKTFNLEIGAPIVRNTPTDVFQFEVQFMHGDADAYTTNTFNIHDHELASRVYSVINQYADDLSDDDNLRDRRRAYQHLEELSGGQADVLKYVMDYLNEGDVMSDYQFTAVIDCITVRYFDEHGNEYEVITKETFNV